MRNQRWLLITLVNSVLIQASMYLSRPMITYRLLEFHQGSFMVGLYGALYVLFPMLLAIPLGHWVNQFGEAKFVVIGTLAVILSTLGLAASHSLLLLAFFVLALGTSIFFCMVGSQALVSNKSPHDSYEKNFGYYTFSASSGQMIGPAIGTMAAGTIGTLPRSTTSGFTAAAILAIIALVPIVGWFREKPTISMSARESRSGMSFGAIMANPGMKVAMFTSLAISSSIDVLTVFLPVFGRDKGFSSNAIALVLVTRAFASMTSRFLLGRLTKSIGFHRLLLSSIVLSSLCCALAFFAHKVTELLILMLVAGFMLGVGQPMTMAWVSRSSKDEERSFTISIRLASNRLGQFGMPAIAGIVAGSLGVDSVFLVIAGVIGVSSPFVRGSRHNVRRQSE